MEPVAYLKTQGKLSAVEHGNLSSDKQTCKLSGSPGSRRETGTPVSVSGHNNRSLARISDYGS